MNARVNIGGLSVDSSLARLVAKDVSPGIGIKVDQFWT